ncbi:MAG TPA: c(7)-type cytochrome triheme domain-containing protein [Bryobacteraceae bacterium]|nr:c(7)-type cytochrome triheme domain-containing protein [Bryobacteraceae bacterium]
MRIPAAVPVVAFLAASLLAQKPPDKLVFEAKNGNVAFSHADHVKRAKNDCKTCHPTLWPQSKTAPLNFKAAMHKTAEAKKTSCAAAACHVEGGQAFVIKGNCKKCHGTAPAKKAD